MMTEADTMLASLLFSVYDDVRFLMYLSMDGGQKFIVWLLMASIAPSLLVVVAGSSQKLGFSGNLSCSTTTKLACSVGRCRAEVAYIGGLQLQLHVLTREGNSKVSDSRSSVNRHWQCHTFSPLELTTTCKARESITHHRAVPPAKHTSGGTLSSFPADGDGQQ